MKKKKIVIIFIAIVFVIILVYKLLIPKLTICREPLEHVVTMIAFTTVSQALGHYYIEYARFPNSSIKEILEILAGKNKNGQNPKKMVFIANLSTIQRSLFSPINRVSLNNAGNLQDGWGSSIRSKVEEDGTIILQSDGKNKKDDAGGGDDLVAIVMPPKGRLRVCFGSKISESTAQNMIKKKNLTWEKTISASKIMVIGIVKVPDGQELVWMSKLNKTKKITNARLYCIEWKKY
jgi:hypothetical protein